MAVVTPANQTAIAELYIALFNRAPDADGFAFWTQALADGTSLESIAQSFVAAPEARAIYGVSQTSTQFVTAYYTSVMGRLPDASGLEFWTAALDSAGGAGSDVARAFVVSQIVKTVNTPLPVKPEELTDSAYALTYADRNVFANKSVVSVFYATEYKGGNSALAKEVLTVVGTDLGTIDVAKALLAGGGSTAPVPTPEPVITSPQHFVGTTSTDNFLGGTADDSFSFVIDKTTPANTTLTAGDKISGGAGNDTLTVNTVGNVINTDLTLASITSVESVIFSRQGLGALTYTAGEEVKTVQVVGGSGNVSLNLTNGMRFIAKDIAPSTVAVNYIDGADGVVTLVGGIDEVFLGVYTAGSAITLTSSGSANVLSGYAMSGNVGTLTLVAASDFTTQYFSGGNNTNVQISGAGKVDVGTLDRTSIAMIDASASTGGLLATLAANHTTVTVIGSQNNDTINVGNVTLTTGSVDGGDGTDRLNVINSAALASKELGDKYTNFEILQVQNGVSVDLDNIVGITSIEIIDGNGSTGVTNLSAAQAEAVNIRNANANGAITIGVKNATNLGQVDTVKASLTTNSGALPRASDLTGITLAGVENLELTGTGIASASTGLVTLNTANALSLESIIVKNAGGASITVSAGHAAQNLSIDASGSDGTVTINAAAYNSGAGVLTVKGGTGADTLTIAQKAEVYGGAGNDTFVLNTSGLALTTASQVGVEEKLVSINDIALGDSIRFDFGMNGGSFTGHVGVQSGLSGTDLYTLAGEAMTAARKPYAAFSYLGDTYVVADINLSEAYEQGDVIVKLAGVNWYELEMRVNAQDVLSVVAAEFG